MPIDLLSMDWQPRDGEYRCGPPLDCHGRLPTGVPLLLCSDHTCPPPGASQLLPALITHDPPRPPWCLSAPPCPYHAVFPAASQLLPARGLSGHQAQDAQAQHFIPWRGRQYGWRTWRRQCFRRAPCRSAQGQSASAQDEMSGGSRGAEAVRGIGGRTGQQRRQF